MDKTHFISKLEKVVRAYFLTRPRRFGKSLFLSTLEAYFEGKKELFKGLAIEKFKENEEEWQTYPVLKLDLNVGDYKDSQELRSVLNAHIEKLSTQFGIQSKFDSPHLNFAYIIEALYKKFNRRVVILVDEYDNPLIATLENEDLQEQYCSILKAFYSVIKSLNGDIHFSFLTGVTKFSKVSIFSDLNNLDDVSFDREYSSLCGITEKELRDNFKSEVQSLANEENTSYDDMLDILRAKYDGYRFSKKEERIYNPFSLLNALSKKEIGDYWFESGTPSFMVKLLEQRDLDIPDLESNVVTTTRDLDVYRID